MAPAAVELLHCASNAKPVQNDRVAGQCTALRLGQPRLGVNGQLLPEWSLDR